MPHFHSSANYLEMSCRGNASCEVLESLYVTRLGFET